MAHWAFEHDVHRGCRRPQLFVAFVGACEQVRRSGEWRRPRRGRCGRRCRRAAHDGKVDAEVGEHAGILRALAGEEEGQALGTGVIEGLVPEIDAASVSDRAAGRVAQFRRHGSEAVGQLGERRGDDSQAGCACRVLLERSSGCRRRP